VIELDLGEVIGPVTLSWLALSGAERRAVAAQADVSRLSWETQLASLPTILAKAAARLA
jgi:hypothetical protein